MEQDKRYITVRKLLESGQLESMAEIVDTVPPSVIARDLGIHYNKFKSLLKDPSGWVMRDLYILANLIGVPGRRITDLIHDQIESKIKKK